MSENKPYDLLLRGGHVICPASEINGVMDVAVRDGKIAAVQKDILPASAKEVVDVRGRLVLPGMIDTHAHVYRYVSGRFGMDADLVGVHSGVTTVIDQGGPSCMTLPGFRHFVAEPAKTPFSVNVTTRPAIGEPDALNAADNVVVPPTLPLAGDTTRPEVKAPAVNASRKIVPAPEGPGPSSVVPYNAPSLPWTTPGITNNPSPSMPNE